MLNKKVIKLAGLVVIGGSLAGSGYAIGQSDKTSTVDSVAFAKAENDFHDHVRYAVMAANNTDEAKKEELMLKSMNLSKAPQTYMTSLSKPLLTHVGN